MQVALPNMLEHWANVRLTVISTATFLKILHNQLHYKTPRAWQNGKHPHSYLPDTIYESRGRDSHRSSRDNPPFQRVARWQAVLRVTGCVLLLRPGRLHQAQGGIECVAAGVIS